jgi:hypothetical protein
MRQVQIGSSTLLACLFVSSSWMVNPVVDKVHAVGPIVARCAVFHSWCLAILDELVLANKAIKTLSSFKGSEAYNSIKLCSAVNPGAVSSTIRAAMDVQHWDIFHLRVMPTCTAIARVNRGHWQYTVRPSRFGAQHCLSGYSFWKRNCRPVQGRLSALTVTRTNTSISVSAW